MTVVNGLSFNIRGDVELFHVVTDLNDALERIDLICEYSIKELTSPT